MSPKPIISPDVELDEAEQTETRWDQPWRLILFNDNDHSFDDVIYQLMIALPCTWDEATKFAETAHTTGKCCVKEDSFEACFKSNTILKEIELITQIEG
jgi:ATP-dependent Clp protease adaptor protein ClpS